MASFVSAMIFLACEILPMTYSVLEMVSANVANANVMQIGWETTVDARKPLTNVLACSAKKYVQVNNPVSISSHFPDRILL